MKYFEKKKSSLKNGEASVVPLLNFEGGSGVPNLNLMGVPGPVLNFEGVPKFWTPGSCTYFYTVSGAQTVKICVFPYSSSFQEQISLWLL